VQMFSDLLPTNRCTPQLIGGGGVATAEHVLQYLDSGANAVHMATAAMIDPIVARRIKQHLAYEASSFEAKDRTGIKALGSSDDSDLRIVEDT